MIYTVIIDAAAERDLKRVDAVVFRRLHTLIKSLSQDPRPPGCKKLKGHGNLYRVRAGDYRVLYSIDDKKIHVIVLRAAHRSDVY